MIDGQQLVALLPLAVPVGVAVAIMLSGAIGVGRRGLHLVAMAGAAASLLAILPARDLAPIQVTELLRVDAFGIFFVTLLYAGVGLLAILSRPYLDARTSDPEAFLALLWMAAAGMGVLACSVHFVGFFLGLEILTVALYAMIGYARERPGSLEAAFKYLLLAALSSALLLFGIALIYAATGTLEIAPALAVVGELAGTPGDPASAWAVAGGLLLLVGFGFKLALVPFHMWSPDVYQGAPAPATMLVATGSKGAVVAALVRALGPSVSLETMAVLLPAATLVAVATMFVGNLLALFQRDLKRLLAYSSVAHLGYVVVGVIAGGTLGAEAVSFYMLTYVLMSLGAFGVVTSLSAASGGEVDALRDYRGLGRERPLLAATLTVMLLSLAGIPPTGGFIAKFAVLGAAVRGGQTGLAVAMALASGLAVFYYLRVIVALYMRDPAPGTVGSTGTVALTPKLALVAIVAAVVVLGVYPAPWLRVVGRAVASLAGG